MHQRDLMIARIKQVPLTCTYMYPVMGKIAQPNTASSNYPGFSGSLASTGSHCKAILVHQVVAQSPRCAVLPTGLAEPVAYAPSRFGMCCTRFFGAVPINLTVPGRITPANGFPMDAYSNQSTCSTGSQFHSQVSMCSRHSTD